MKIALINSLYKPFKRGGAEVVFANIVQELKNDGHDIFVITLSEDPKKTDFFQENIDGVTVYRFFAQNIFSFIHIDKQALWKRLIWHIIDTFNWQSYQQIKKILKSKRPDLVLTHNLKGLGYLTLRAIKILRIRNIHTLHDVQLVNPSGLLIKGREKPGILLKIYFVIIRYLFASPSVVVSPSKWLLDFYQDYGFFAKSKKVVIPNPVIFNRNNVVNKKFGQTINYLFIGQIEEHKGILFLLKVFEQFQKNGNFHLSVVGTGSLLANLKEQYQSCQWVDFLDYIPHDELANIFQTIHYTIIPSLCYENSPSVIYDSFLYGTPVIAAAIGGIPELVKDGVNGYLFEAGSEIGLLNKLNLSLQQIARFPQWSENAKIKLAEYDIKNYVYKLLHL